VITKVTKDNKGLYKALFEKAGAEYSQLGNGTVEINTIDEYFACFKSLADLNQVFTVLPLDEPTLDIDANTRAITIPADFKKNGISVQGDQVAEIVYFTIDRYFDTTDLYDDDVNIIIQWETASNGKTTNKGVSPAILKDISIRKDEGKMLFGWAINSNITEYAGTIKFSARFYRTQLGDDKKPKITFSLSTLTATAVVNPGLNYEFVNGTSSVQVYDDTALVKNRFKDSVTPDTVVSADEPEFLYAIPNSEDDCFKHETINLGTEEDPDNVVYHYVDLIDAEPAYYTFKAQAVSEAGIITYEWTRTPLGSAQADSLDGTVEYFLTTDTVYSGEHPYYLKSVSDSGIVSYSVFSISSAQVGTEIPEDSVGLLYERFNTLTATQTGDYRVKALNRNGIASKEKYSDIVRIPGPEALTVEYPEHQETTYLADSEEEDKEGVGVAVLSATGSTPQDGDKITYTWYHVGEEDAVQTAETEIEISNSLNIPEVGASDRALYDEQYKVSVYASRNGDSTDVQTYTFRVTDPAHQPIVSPNGTQFDLIPGTELTLSAKIQVDDIVADEITYTWYKMVVSPDAGEDLTINDPTNDLRISELDAVAVYDTETKAVDDISVSIDVAGTYYCVVTNHANGSVASTTSERIRVSPV
jgi:hypothetical protein